ncbi:MAG: alpha/beta fold hydrolase [Devosia sp.]|nr:alpha/beta fold hydrolase [Devosia sp.]
MFDQVATRSASVLQGGVAAQGGSDMTIRLAFRNRAGHLLHGRLEVGPVPVRQWAIFAHCFACGKKSNTAVRISRALARHGIGVLRFDFTGLDESEGAFGHGLSQDIADLEDAIDHMRLSGRPVTLVVGHSMGGVAALAVAHSDPSIRAVATIGAPFKPRLRPESHSTDDGPPDHSSAALWDGAGPDRQREAIASLGKALLVVHAADDTVVPVDDASALFEAAAHPKSLLLLDRGDHFVQDPADAGYVAAGIAAWNSRHAPSAEQPVERLEGIVRAEETGIGKFQLAVRTSSGRLIADEPVSAGGLGSGPAPYELLEAALAACTVMTCRLYADRKGWNLRRVSAEVEREARGRDGTEIYRKRVAFEGDLDSAQRERLTEIAGRCPVHRTLTGGGVVIETREADPVLDREWRSTDALAVAQE